jgi:hypothetical protein
MEIGNPKNHMELIKPSCSALRPKVSPNWGNIPARMAKVNAVVMRAKQLALKSAERFIESVIGKGLGLRLRNKQLKHLKVGKILHSTFPLIKKKVLVSGLQE